MVMCHKRVNNMNMYGHDLFIAICYMIDEDNYGKVLFVVLLNFANLSDLSNI